MAYQTQAPCEFGSAGGTSCSNPNNPSDEYDWGVYVNGVFQPYRNGYEYRNCTDYVQWKESTIGVSVPSNWGNGGSWYNSAPAGDRSTTPKAWDAAVEPGDPGHVAFVESVNSGGTITVSEYNHNMDGTGDTRTGTASSMGFTEFVDFGVHPSGGGSGFSAFNTFDWPHMAFTGLSGLQSNGQGFGANQYIMSQNGEFSLELTGNGNLAEYGGSSGSSPSAANTKPIWNNNIYSGSLTASSGGLVLQSDGNLVLYNGNGSVLWSTGTGGNSGDNLVVQNDGNVVLYSWSGVAMWSTGGSGSFTASNTWTSGLSDGQSLSTCSMLTSADNRFHLLEECNGDLYEYGPGNSPMWHTNTDGSPGSTLVLQSSDGNLVLYNSSGAPIWATGTGGNTGDNLVVQNDGNVVLYSWSGVAMWSTGT